MGNSYSSDARATRVLRRQTATVLGTLPHLRRPRHAEPVAHLSRSLPLLALARCLQNGQVIFFGSRVTHSRSACAPQTASLQAAGCESLRGRERGSESVALRALYCGPCACQN
jgi:hypothetical protein